MRSKAVPGGENVPIAHVPVPSGGCWLIPCEDLRVPERFSVWSRFLCRDGIFWNIGWQTRGPKLFADDRVACRPREPETIARLVQILPQALLWPEVLERLVKAAAALDPELFRAIARRLEEERPRRLGKRAQRAVEEIHWEAAQENPGGLSRRKVMSSLTNGEEESGAGYEKLHGLYKRFVKAAKTYPRVRAVGVENDQHDGHTGRIYFGFSLPAEEAPRLYFSPSDHPRLRKGEMPPGQPLIPPRFDSKWKIRLDPQGGRFALITPTIPIGRAPKK